MPLSIQEIINSFIALAYLVPLEIFVSVGLFLDEIILPVPAPIMLTIAGSIAKTQDQSFFYLFILAILGGIGKMLGMWFYYFLGDKAEHLLIPKYGKLFGITQKEIDKLSNKMKGGWRDVVFIFLTRVIPFVPTTPVSLVCGILKINLKSFLITSFVGTTIRNYIFLYVGYVGASNYQFFKADYAEKITLILMILFCAGFSAWYYWKKKGERASK